MLVRFAPLCDLVFLANAIAAHSCAVTVSYFICTYLCIMRAIVICGLMMVVLVETRDDIMNRIIQRRVSRPLFANRFLSDDE
jgi:hypothetical protein